MVFVAQSVKQIFCGAPYSDYLFTAARFGSCLKNHATKFIHSKIRSHFPSKNTRSVLKYIPCIIATKTLLVFIKIQNEIKCQFSPNIRERCMAGIFHKFGDNNCHVRSIAFSRPLPMTMAIWWIQIYTLKYFLARS
jgi:hypothetical protein